MDFSTKADNLKNLEGILTSATLLPQYRVSQSRWIREPEKVLGEFLAKISWANKSLIVRSNFSQEDGAEHSLAGYF